VLVEALPENMLSVERTSDILKTHFALAQPETFCGTPEEAYGLALLLYYVARSQRMERLAHLQLPKPLHASQSLRLGPRTAQHLDLFTTDPSQPSLFGMINKTGTALGARRLRQWLSEPLMDVAAIQGRQQAVRELQTGIKTGLKVIADLRPLSQALAEIYDLERILGRVHAGLANPADTLALARSLSAAKKSVELIEAASSPALLKIRTSLKEALESLAPLTERILATQIDPAPLLSREGGVFKKGTQPDLDRLIDLSENGQKWLVDLEAREREQTGISSLKVRYNRVFGYYIEITQAHLKSAPAHYQRKQTMVGAERFFTDELKKFEEEILTSGSKQKSLEQELFAQLLGSVRERNADIMAVALAISELDCLQALARLAALPGWVFPQLDDSQALDIQAGRHPLVDEALRDGFVPNSVKFTPPTRSIILITGPNMGGKSTVMRQTALIVILGQMGAPVPAASATWGVFSSVFTRIGAHDAIAKGQSTFMVEMSELAHILHHGDERSLIVLDEIGRGTSTYDGISVAWATLEWISTKIRARTLFATHYHELTRLSEKLTNVANAHMAVESEQGRKAQAAIRFLYELREGPSSESFGIQVARLAGLPSPLIQRAWKVLEELERQSPTPTSADLNQLSLFDARLTLEEPAAEETVTATPQDSGLLPLQRELLKELGETDINTLTPIEALNVLAKLRDNARGFDSGSA
jgi:DNA mismatch repair protein MutS